MLESSHANFKESLASVQVWSDFCYPQCINQYYCLPLALV